MRFSIRSKIIVLCIAFLLIFIPSILFLVMNLADVIKSFRWTVHEAEVVMGRAHLLSKLIIDMETGQRGFIITGKEEFLEPFNAANKKFDNILTSLRQDLTG